jgi:hypothetical protein
VRSNSKLLIGAVAGMAVAVSFTAGSAFGRGGGSGHSSGGQMSMSRANMSNRPVFTNNNSRTANFNAGRHLQHNGVQHVLRAKGIVQKPHWKGKSGYWKKYCDWKKGYGYWGFGWGCWDTPDCGGWVCYEPLDADSYSNPYCGEDPSVDGVDYSTPINRLAESPADPQHGDPQNSEAYSAAQHAFREGDLDGSLKAISQALVESPRNREVHQLHSLVLFARKDYHRSAAVAHAVLQDGPGWKWNTLQKFYSSPEGYTEQLRSLEGYVKANPAEADVRLLLAYHYLMLNHLESAKGQLAHAVAMEPKDKLASRILNAIDEAPSNDQKVTENLDQSADKPATPPTLPSELPPTDLPSKDAAPNGPPSEPPSEDAPTTPPAGVPSSPIAGAWKASPAPGVKIDLKIGDNGTFVWNFTAKGESREFKGDFKLVGDRLTLTRAGDANPMEGTFERTAANAFRFRMLNTDSDDPGLSFTR